MTNTRREAIRRVLDFVDALEAAGVDVVSPRLLDNALAGPNRATLELEAIKLDADGVDADALQDALASGPTTEQITEDSEDVSDDNPEKWCGHCGDGFVSAQGVKIHTGQSHDADPQILEEPPETDASQDAESSDDDEPTDHESDEIEDELPDLGLDLPDDITAEAVRSVAHAESVTTVQEAARELELETAATRALLTNMGLRPQVDLDEGGELA